MPDEGLLPIGVREWNIFQALIPWIDGGGSANQFYQQIVGTELGIRRSTFYEIVRNVKDTLSYGEYLGGLSGSRVPVARDMPDWAFTAQEGFKYRVRLSVSYTDSEGNDQTLFRDLNYTRLHTMDEFANLSMNDVGYAVEEAGGTLSGYGVAYMWRL